MLIRADARRIPLVDSCAQMVVTSPPYWGLRDYGTAQWDGGDPACDHRAPSRFDYALNPGLGPTGVQDQSSNIGSGSVQQYRDVCGKCGARRIDNQIGLESTPDEYVAQMVQVFREVKRVLKDDGTLWLNLGDSYASNAATAQNPAKHSGGFESYRGSDTPTLNTDKQGRIAYRGSGIKAKDLIGIPWRVAFALQADGWYLRSDIIWAKGVSFCETYSGSVMPESVTDRPTKGHEYLFLLSKQASYFYDVDAVKERGVYPAGTKAAKGSAARAAVDGVNARPTAYAVYDGTRNLRTVWAINPANYPDAHFATYPEKLIEPCILAGSRVGDLVLDPFIGSGTTGAVCDRLMRRWVGTDLSYQHLSKDRTRQRGLRLEDTA